MRLRNAAVEQQLQPAQQLAGFRDGGPDAGAERAVVGLFLDDLVRRQAAVPQQVGHIAAHPQLQLDGPVAGEVRLALADRLLQAEALGPAARAFADLGGGEAVQRVHAQRRGLVVLQGEQVEARAALEEGLGMELGPALLAGAVAVSGLQGARLGERFERGEQDFLLEVGRQQALGVAEDAQLVVPEAEVLPLFAQARQDPLQALLGHRVADQRAHQALGVGPQARVGAVEVGFAPVALGLAARIDDFDIALLHQRVQVALDRPHPGGVGFAGLVVFGQAREQLARVRAALAGGVPGDEPPEQIESVDAVLVGDGHGRLLAGVSGTGAAPAT